MDLGEDKYLVFARDLKKLWNMKGTMIPIVDVTLGSLQKNLKKILGELEIWGKTKTIQTTVRIYKEVLENWADLLLLS